MSGAAGGTRIPRAAVDQTVKDFVTKVLSKIPGFKSAKISGSYNQPVKQDFGDIDLVVSIEGDKPKKEVKKMIVDYFEGLSDKELPYLNTEKHKGKKAINHGEIITNLYPISGMPGEFVQIDNIIAVSESEGDFKKVVLDYPAEIQGLILGLVKTPLLEEDPEQVFKRMGIKDIPSLGPNQEYEFHLDTSGLSLKIVTLDENYRQLDSNIVWESTSFEDVKRLLKDFNLDGTFDQFIKKIKTFKNPRSKNRVKGFFKTSIKVGPAEQGTPKGDGKQQALDTVAALEEKHGSFVTSLIKPLLLEQEGTIAIFPGKFKPPHKDHLARIQAAAKMADQVRVIIGPNPVAKTDEAAISAQEAMAIFDLYKKKNLIPDNVTFEISDLPSPVLKAYKEFENNPEQRYIAVFGKDDAARFKGLAKMPNVTVNNFPEANIGDASATDLRKAIATQDLVAMKPFLPFGVSPAEYLDALNMPVKEPMSEGKSIKKLRVFDFDDTLAHIKALIRITHQDGTKEELTPAEYAVYNPQAGDKFNFSDFNKVIRQARPIENNVQDLIRSYKDPTEKTTILTARMLGYPVKKYLKDEFGIEPYVVGLGSADPMDKAKWIEQQIHKGYNDIEFRDDSKKNVDAVTTLQDKYPDVRLASMLAESYKGKRTNDGAPGTFKAKITKAYGGDVTIEKARKFKNRDNATALDKQQANWFINFHSKNEGLNEGKQVGILYHYTSADGLKGILSSNRIKASEEIYMGQNLYYVSFTRNKNFHKKGSKFGVKTEYRITLDGDKLSNKYKITPHAYKPGYDYTENWEYDWLEDEPENIARDFFAATGEYDEQEERISFKDPQGGIDNIKNYILAVDKVEDLQEGKAAPYGSGYKPLEEQLTPYIVSLTKHMFKQGLTIDPAPEIEFIEDEDNAKNPLGKTAYYDPNSRVIVLYTTGRHPKDILRSFAHEMIHHCQNLEGRLGDIHTTNVNEDDYLKSLEREAYERGNMAFRSWENSLRGDNGVRYIKGFAPGEHNDEPIMAEGKYDSLSNRLSAMIFKKWKKDFEAGKEKSHFEWYVIDDKTELEFDLIADALFVDEDIYSVDGGANAGNDAKGEDPHIEASFVIDIQLLPRLWEKISYDLKDFMRHEIEHLTQQGPNLIPSKERASDQARRDKIKAGEIPAAKYPVLRSEIEPMLQGMYFSAKKQRRPFIDVINDWFNSRGFTEEEKKNVLKVWRPYLKQLSLPKF